MTQVAVVLAAGKGTRMHTNRHKLLHSLAGEPIIHHVLRLAQACCQRVLVVIGHCGHEVQQACSEFDCEWIIQDEQRGTAHAVIQALPYLAAHDTALILSGDVPLLHADDCSSLLAHAEKTGFALMTALADKPQGLGRIIRSAEDQRILAIVEDRDASAEQRAIQEINAGVYACAVSELAAYLPQVSCDNQQGEFYLPDIIDLAVRDAKCVVTIEVSADTCQGVNDLLQLAQVERIYQARLLNRYMQAGLCVRDPARCDVRGTLTFGTDVEIDINCIIKGTVHCGDGVKIGPSCILEDCSLGSHTIVYANSLIQQSKIAPHCRIGPYARLRPGCHLDEHVRVGNFVEIKQSRLHTATKVNHLSYIGDASLGASTNIGAGTITCNYDGVHKQQTIIGDDVFIGSNSALIAPISIGHQATVAAGSVVTKDVPAHSLAVGRSTQRTISNWQHAARVKDKES